jgi:hypothetical protein
MAPEMVRPKAGCKSTKPAKKARKATKKPAGKPKADRTNMKADVIATMKRTKRATLPEIMNAHGAGLRQYPGQ